MKSTSRSIALAGLVFLLVGALPASAWTWPIVGQGREYQCHWKFLDGPHKGLSGDARLLYKSLDGNDYLRRGEVLNTYNDGSTREAWITVTKPVSCGAKCTKFEYTVNRPEPSIQCQNFRAEIVEIPRPFGGTVELSRLTFDGCSNYVFQTCSRPNR